MRTVLYILVEFESDRMSPRESAKNGRICAHGLNCIIFVDSELIFEIYDKNYPRKKYLVIENNFCLINDNILCDDFYLTTKVFKYVDTPSTFLV